MFKRSFQLTKMSTNVPISHFIIVLRQSLTMAGSDDGSGAGKGRWVLETEV